MVVATWSLFAVALTAAEPPVDSSTNERDRMVVLPLDVDGELPEHFYDELTRRLHGGLARGFDVVAPSNTAVCDTMRCQLDATRASYATVVTVAVSRRDYEIRFRVARASDAAIVLQSRERCELCGIAEVGDVVTNQAAAIRERLRSLDLEAPQLLVRTDPPGAVVWIDGIAIGPSPVATTVAAGEHKITVRHDGYGEQARRFDAVAGVHETFDFGLRPITDDRGPDSRLRTIGWVGLGLGAASLGTGIALMAIEERPNRFDCEGDNVDADGDCRYRYATFEAGLGLSLGALAPLVTSTVLLVRGRGERGAAGDDRRTRIGVGPSGVWVTGEF